jgi:hypothetical protein
MIVPHWNENIEVFESRVLSETKPQNSGFFLAIMKDSDFRYKGTLKNDIR